MTTTITLSLHLQSVYTMLSAALSNFLPGIPVSSHLDIFRELRLYLHLSKLEQRSMDMISNLVIEGEVPEMFKNPHIICTYHTGSYRMINLWLIKNHLPFALVIGEESMQAEGVEFMEFYKKNNMLDTSGLEVINANSGSSTLQMIRALKAGKSLVVYIDGNQGAGRETKQNKNTCLVTFMGNKIHARTGIGYLSHKTNVPVLPVCCYRPDGLSIHIKFGNFIVPDLQATREQFATYVTRRLFSFIAPVIKKYPAQWEGWLYIHKVIYRIKRKKNTPRRTSGNQVMFNQQDYGIFKLERKAFLLQKNAYKIFPISANLYKCLKVGVAKPLPVSGFDPQVLEELEKAGVLTFV